MTIEKRIENARKTVISQVGRHREIAKAVDSSYNWVRRFASGALKEPGAIKFAKLEDWIAKHL